MTYKFQVRSEGMREHTMHTARFNEVMKVKVNLTIIPVRYMFLLTEGTNKVSTKKAFFLDVNQPFHTR